MAKTHIHKYKRTDIGSGKKEYIVMQCALPGCGHYLPHLNLALGRDTICWRCEAIFTLEQDNLEQVYPHCSNCTRAEDDAKRAAAT